MANWAAYCVAALVGFFLAPYVLHRLGNSTYGLWVLLASLVSYLGLLDLGIRGSITRFIAHHHATGDHVGSSRIIVGALRVFTVLGTAAMLFAVLLAVFVDGLFEIPDYALATVRSVIVVGGATVAASFLGGVFGGIIAGLHRFDVDSGLEIVLTVIRAAAVVAALENHYGLLGLALIQFGITALRGLVSFVACRRLYPQLSLLGIGPLAETTQTLLTFSVFSSVIHISTVVLYYSDSVLIGAILPVGMITFFAIATSLVEYARSIADAVARIVTPRVSAAQAAGGQAAAAQVFLKVGQATSILIVPIAVTFILRGETFINLWMGPDYGAVSGPILVLLAVRLWFAGGRSVAIAGLIGVNHHRGLATAMAAEAVLNLALAVLLIEPLGLMGVALGALVPSLLLNLGFVPRSIGNAVGVRPADFVRQVWVRPTIAVIPFGVATYLVERTWPASSFVMFFGQVLVLLPLIAVAGLLQLTTADERARMWAGFRDRAVPSRRSDAASA